MNHPTEQKLNLEPIEYCERISNESFIEDHVRAEKPVVIRNLVDDWAAPREWTFDRIKEVAGDKTVPVYDNRKANKSTQYKFNEPHLHMPLSEFIDSMLDGPTPYRIFLFNLLKEAPELQNDFTFPEGLGLHFLKSLPMMFFGGENSKVFMHYDIDYANILHFQFQGKKKCILYPPSETQYLYKLPNALSTHPDIDFTNPDLERFPALAKAKGVVAELNHGDALYMPEGWWHQMTYVTPGFSMSLRALSTHKVNFAKACYNMVVMRSVDNLMRSVRGDKWLEFKKETALNKSNALA